MSVASSSASQEAPATAFHLNWSPGDGLSSTVTDEDLPDIQTDSNLHLQARGQAWAEREFHWDQWSIDTDGHLHPTHQSPKILSDAESFDSTATVRAEVQQEIEQQQAEDMQQMYDEHRSAVVQFLVEPQL